MALLDLTSVKRSMLIMTLSFHFIQSVNGLLPSMNPTPTSTPSNGLLSNMIPSYVARYCVNGTDDNNLFLEGNSRATLMSDLTLHASNQSFYATKSTSGNNTSYGYFYCTANVAPEDCHTCVLLASNHCMFKNAGFVFYVECTIRFSTQPVLGIADYESITAWTYSVSPLTNKQFNETLYSTLSQVIPNAVNATSRYATGESSLAWTSDKLYALGQCTPDIAVSDCETCLKVALKNMPLCDNSTCTNPHRESIFTFLPSCQLRYEVRSPSSTYGTIPSSSFSLGKNVWYIMLALLLATVALY